MKLSLCAVPTLLLAGLLAVPAAALDAPEAPLTAQFEQALRMRDDGDLVAARRGFEAILAERPDLHRARLELALTCLESGDYDHARSHAQAVLDDLTIPPQVRLTVLAFLAKVKAEQERPSPRTTRAALRSFSIGFMHDDNVNAGPGNVVVQIPNTNVTASGGARPLQDNALVVNLNLPFRRSLELTGFGGAPGGASWYWAGEANLYARSYFDDSPYNLDVLSLMTGPAVEAGAWQGSLNGRVDLVRQGSGQLALFASLQPSFTLRLVNTSLTLEGRLQHRNYSYRVNDGYDSFYKSIAVLLEQPLLGGNVTIGGGLGWFAEDARSGHLSNQGERMELRADWRAWRDGRVYLRASRENFDYEGIEPVVEVRRYDREDRLSVGIDHTFRDGSIKDWTVSGIYEHTRHRSNVSTYDYWRNQTQLALGRTF